MCCCCHQDIKQHPHSKNSDAESDGRTSSRVRAFVAFLIWFIFLLGAIPFYVSRQQGWSYEQSVHFAYVTMSTIGYGDFVPNKDISRYRSGGLLWSHPVYVWTEWHYLLNWTFAAFGMLGKAVQDLYAFSAEEEETASLLGIMHTEDDRQLQRNIAATIIQFKYLRHLMNKVRRARDDSY